ncbi:MAG TPA: hypothetical protein ENN60_03885 [archaeon]|nr:hypothetical protein [archaeon]
MIEARFIMEYFDSSKSLAENHLKKRVEVLKGLKEIEIFDEHWEETQQMEDGTFSALIDLGIRTKSIEAFFAIIMGFTPTAVIIQKADKLQVGMKELQNVSNDTVTVIRNFARANSQLRKENLQLRKLSGMSGK